MNLWNKQYQFDRDYFVSTFNILAPNYIKYIIEHGEWYNGEEFIIYRVNDEIYIVELDTGIIINYYKHLGRCNQTNCDLSKKDFEDLLKRLNDENWSV